MCLKSILLEIKNIALPSREHLLKVSGHSTEGDLSNIQCTLDLIMCTFKAYMLESTFLEIQNIALPYREHLLKVSDHSTKGDL